MEYLGLNLDMNRDSLFDDNGIRRLKDSYMRPDEESPQHRFAHVSKQFSTDHDHAQRLYEYSSKHWLSYATPILSFGRSKKGLPISCFLNYVPDTADGLVDTLSETNWLSMLGGGVGIGFGVRAADDQSTGVMPHLKIYDASSLAYRQGKTRRGSYAAYLDISHPDIMQFIEMRKPTGDPNIRCLNMHHGVNITNDFMQIIETCMYDKDANDEWELKDPHSSKVKEIVSAKDLWQRLIKLRMETGEPYFHFIDTSNNEMPAYLKSKGLKINQSNLCSEILLPTDEDRTAVCCLSSVNLEYYDEWKSDPKFLPDILEMLDNVLQYFIDYAPDEISRAKYSAITERSVGVGALGFHAYLQKNSIPFESAIAKSKNMTIFKHIRENLDAANKALGPLRGSPSLLAGTNLRNAHVMAVAPNATSSILMGNTSPSIEPFKANAYRQDTLSGTYLNKNKHLDKLILTKIEEDDSIDYDKIWSSINSNDGSIQHLKIFDENEKYVFKTALEIDQRWIIEHAADRQFFIDQGQSVNLFFRPDASLEYLHAIHFLAWKQGLKTLYYCRSEKIGKADKISKKIERNIIKELDMAQIATGEDCIACEG